MNEWMNERMNMLSAAKSLGYYLLVHWRTSIWEQQRQKLDNFLWSYFRSELFYYYFF